MFLLPMASKTQLVNTFSKYSSNRTNLRTSVGWGKEAQLAVKYLGPAFALANCACAATGAAKTVLQQPHQRKNPHRARAAVAATLATLAMLIKRNWAGHGNVAREEVRAQVECGDVCWNEPENEKNRSEILNRCSGGRSGNMLISSCRQISWKRLGLQLMRKIEAGRTANVERPNEQTKGTVRFWFLVGPSCKVSLHFQGALNLGFGFSGCTSFTSHRWDHGDKLMTALG